MSDQKFYAEGCTVTHRPSGVAAEFRSPAEARRAAREANARDKAESARTNRSEETR